MRTRIALATLTLGAALLIAPAAEARQIGLEPVGWGDLKAACGAAGGKFFHLAGIYSCTVENCDGKGGTCQITCDETGGLVTCDADVPRIRHARHTLSADLLKLLGLGPRPVLPASSLTGGSGGSAGLDGSTGGGDPKDGTFSTGNAGNDAGAGGTVIY